MKYENSMELFYLLIYLLISKESSNKNDHNRVLEKKFSKQLIKIMLLNHCSEFCLETISEACESSIQSKSLEFLYTDDQQKSQRIGGCIEQRNWQWRV